MEKLVVGMAVGCVLGALLVTNNRKLHTLVQKGQDELMERINQTIDEKIAMFEGEGGEEKPQKPTKKVKA